MPSSINRQLRERGEVANEATVHLKYTEREVQYHCMYCAKGIFRQQGRLINVYLAGEPEQSEIMTVPTSVQCHRCGCVYHVATMNR